jgi:hypothetical protein
MAGLAARSKAAAWRGETIAPGDRFVGASHRAVAWRRLAKM